MGISVLTLLEITGDDIAALEDDDLRALIGRLCEADYRSAGLSTKGITWGGHQDAKDGGLDVVVRDTFSPPTSSNVPRSSTGFQVKKPDMPRSEILKEMRSKGELRPSIKALLEEKGAYVIVCSSGSVAETALTNRRTAMKEAVTGEVNYEGLHLDFLDRGRVATWVRSHPSLILWIRNKIGSPMKGWRPFDNWAYSPGGLEEEYLLDDGLRLLDRETPSDKGQAVAEALEKIRAVLTSPGASVRLTGLSGVGKTRFVQALFDSRVGKHTLNLSQAVYTDMSDGPEPDPVTLANQLINDKSRAVLIVDNCPPDLHRRLTKTCSRTYSTVSLISVEYDVRDDIPEERTSIFRLEPASNDLIEKLIANRYPYIGQVDARTIAEFSGGNARVAIALANTVRHGETLSGFRNEELFERLFWQRHDPNESLLVSAQACALVYSFQGEDATSESSELRFLGSLIGTSGEELYRHVAALKQRDLIQSRSVWRAILPHAIANRLASQALETIPKEMLVNGFLTRSPERLIKSFTHRMSYLHDSENAVTIVETWLGPEGWIGKTLLNLSGFGADVLKNIAPVSPAATLSAIERAANGSDGATFASRENPHHTMFVRLLRHLAYDPDLFERSVNLIVRFALTEDENERQDSIRNVLQSLFQIHLSGTHATVEARATIIQALLESDKVGRQELGFLLLDEALETWHFSASHEFEFGARPRDYGYAPETGEDVVHWLGTFMEICTKLALSDHPHAQSARKILASNLRGLWTKGGMFAAIEGSAERLLKQGAWNEGWIAVRGIIRYDNKGFDEEKRERLLSLEKRLNPQDLLEKARMFALSDQHGSFDLEDAFDDDEPVSAGYRRAEEATREIGAAVAGNPEVFQELLPSLVSTHNTRLYHFGQGLAEGAADRKQLFKALRNAVEKTPRDKRQINVILGFVSYLAEADSALFNATLDELVNDDVFGEWFPILQTTSKIDERGVERLHKSLNLGRAPVHTFQYLALGRSHEPISDDDLASLLDKILTRDGGVGVAIEILQMRFHGNREETYEYAEALLAAARTMLVMHPFDQKQRQRGSKDYAMASIAARSLAGSDGADATKLLAKKLADAILYHQTYKFDYIQLLNKLAELQPKIFLDEFLGREDVEQYKREWLFSDDSERRENPMTNIPDEMIIAWCEQHPSSRYPIAIAAVDTFEKSTETEKYEWRPIVNCILRNAPELEKVLEQLGRALRPSGWSGSLADILEKRSVLLQDLQDHENAEVVSWAKSHYIRLQQGIASEREREQAWDRDRNESFE